MRQRKAKDLDKRLHACSRYLTDCSSGDTKGSFFDDEQDLYLEIGCGKGSFIIKKALTEPEKNFLAIEGQETVILRALEKAREVDGECTGKDGRRALSNLKFMLAFVHDMSSLFREGQLSGIYLNFSDPWPKARHAKRRLTYRKRLQDYAWALKEGGFIECKTDNDDLYAFTLEELRGTEFVIVEQTDDLHSSSFLSRLTTTDYEDKFKAAGKNIHYVKAVKNRFAEHAYGR